MGWMGAADFELQTAANEELCGYTLTHGGKEFIHQYVVDAWAAQHATPEGKPIAITFALVGLYLMLEKGFTGREVQLVHIDLAKRKMGPWPTFTLPQERGAVTTVDVMTAPEGPERELAIRKWCSSVWDAYRPDNEAGVAGLLAQYGISRPPRDKSRG